MKKLMFIAALGLLSTQAHALMDLSAFGGYTTLTMTDLNDAITGTGPTPAGTTITKFGGGYFVGVDAAFTVMPMLKVGPRIEYAAGSASVKSAGGSTQFDAGLTSLMVGVSSDLGAPMTGLSIRGGLYGGYGMGSFKQSSTPTSGTGYTSASSGNGIVAELNAEARYSIMPTIALGLDLGYRLAKITQMTLDSESPASTPSKVGKVLQVTKAGAAPSDLAFDFSGMNIGASLSFNF